MNTWGGKRSNAGRPSSGVNKTIVVRIDAELGQIVQGIKDRFKETGSIDNLFNVTTNQDEPNNAIDLIQENKRLAKDNAQLTIKANEEHISRVSLEAKHDKQIKGLNNLIYKLNDKPLAGRCDELETEVTALKNQISNHTHTSQEYALLESKNKVLTDRVAGLEDDQVRANDSIAKMLKSNTLTSMANNYDGYGSLHSAVVDLIGCPASAKSSTNKFIKAAVDALGIKKIGNKYSTEQRKQMYDWIEALPVITKQVREI